MWSGIAALGVLLLGLLIYVKACEKPIEGFSPATETELLAIADEILGDTPANLEWSGKTTFVADEDVLSDSEQEAADAILDQQAFPTRLSNDLIQVAVGDAMSHNTFSKGYGPPLRPPGLPRFPAINSRSWNVWVFRYPRLVKRWNCHQRICL